MSQVQRIIPIAPAVDFPGIAPAIRIQSRSITGVFTRWRWSFVLLTQLLFYWLPWLNWNGRQAVWFDLDGGRFYFFNTVLFPQDLILLTGVLVFSALLLFAATALFGRVWCGFACPQTVYTEMFTWIEQRFEGDRLTRLRLDEAPWRTQKLLRRGGKHFAWSALALLTGFMFVGWFTPVRALAQALPTLNVGPWEGFWIVCYGVATYVHAGLLREKVCQHACPYGRFQGSMLDPASRVIAYDEGRGEPRAARARGVDPRGRGQGDCVDCTLCIQVCPVGIDIRQGLQAACISCGLCIDACNQVMDKLGSPRGLIRFRSMAGDSHPTFWKRPRVAWYGLGLMIVASAVLWGWATRPELRLSVLRDRSVMARLSEDGGVENVYRLQLMNASLQPRRLKVSAFIDGATALPMVIDRDHAVEVAPASTAMTVLTLRMSPWMAQHQGPARMVPIRVEVREAAGGRTLLASSPSTFALR
ncbi:MAG: cytochrome c oxidase accessory protein CcoG [Piscinibacter sp.]|uniref:cytochrome c oxidase accessory protein CcoG n=1 Tax=Piscinibacter sp. TaxID=1903157 RepID=UPI002589331C|nr:cytochrome c oxidase accessory protein CcoG [Piscinibacter sp.]MCW5662875.1 cytochrome c oxidase accessory protein CcoG [Piscinibacter sp.]